MGELMSRDAAMSVVRDLVAEAIDAERDILALREREAVMGIPAADGLMSGLHKKRDGALDRARSLACLHRIRVSGEYAYRGKTWHVESGQLGTYCYWRVDAVEAHGQLSVPGSN